jgi:hypothetical protein
MSCRWDRDAEDYLVDGAPCRTDDYGDPTRHCSARRTCANHIGHGELTCARCIGRTRVDLHVIRDLAALMLPVALGAGVNSEAANLAGPATDVRTWSERRTAMKAHLLAWEALGRISERQYAHARATMEDDDEQHPYTVLTRWQMMLAEDYAHPLPERLTTDTAGDYLERNLHRLAQDDEQDFPLFACEIRRCRSHLESVMVNSRTPERGAPCPDCRDEDRVVRMVREYGHWCMAEDCERIHYADDSGDRWVCPRNRDHWRTHEDYSRWLEDRGKVG